MLPILMRVIFAGFILAAAWGCSHDHRVRIEPELYVRPSTAGQQLPVAVRVVDARPRRAIYEKEAGPRTKIIGSLNKVNIYPGTPVDDPIREKVEQGLSTLGFQPVRGDKKGPRWLRIEVLQLRMISHFQKPKLKIPARHVRLRIALRVNAQTAAGTYRKIYRTQLDKSSKVLTGGFKNEQFINNGLSLTLQKIFEDASLIAFLSATP
ncbi:MAG: YajG family lipoprotein [Nitrospinaceae bacterium]